MDSPKFMFKVGDIIMLNHNIKECSISENQKSEHCPILNNTLYKVIKCYYDGQVERINFKEMNSDLWNGWRPQNFFNAEKYLHGKDFEKKLEDLIS